MATLWTRQLAGLVAGAQALATVAETLAAVHFTRQHLGTGETTRDILQVASNVASLLVLSHAPFPSEVCARRTLLFTVAVVKHRMVTPVSPCAWICAVWGLGATGDGRVQHGLPTVARQLIKA